MRLAKHLYPISIYKYVINLQPFLNTETLQVGGDSLAGKNIILPFAFPTSTAWLLMAWRRMMLRYQQSFYQPFFPEYSGVLTAKINQFESDTRAVWPTEQNICLFFDT